MATCLLKLLCKQAVKCLLETTAIGLIGSGKVNWHSLVTVFSSEMLKFEEEQRLLEEAANALALERPHTPPSRKGSGNVEQLSSPRGNTRL